MKIRKSLMLILSILFLGVGVISGCTDKFANLSATFEKQEISVYFKEKDGQKTSDTFTVSLHGLPKDSSYEIYDNAENPDVAKIDVILNKETGVSTVTVSPKNGGSTLVSFIHKDSNKVVGKVKVNAINPVESISQNSLNGYVVVDQSNPKPIVLNGAQLIEFNPQYTTQKEIEYSLISNINGASLTPSGVLNLTQIPDDGIIKIKASVVGTNVSTELSLKVLRALQNSDITISKLVNDQYVALMDNEPIVMVGNRPVEKEVQIKTEVDYMNDYQVVVEHMVVDSLSSILENLDENSKILMPFKKLTNEEGIIECTGKTGNSYVLVKAYVKGYENCNFQKVIPVSVIEVPQMVEVWDQDNESKDAYDIYDNYTNNLGKLFNVLVKNSSANSLKYVLQMTNEDRQLVDIVYESGENVNTVETLNQDSQTVLSSRFYVKARENAPANKQITLNVVAFGGIGHSSPAQKTITLTLRKGVSSINVVSKPNNVDMLDKKFYVQVGQSLSINFAILDKNNQQNNVYSSKYTIIADNEQIFERKVVLGEQGVYSYLADLVALKQGETVVTIYAENGVSTSITVRAFINLQNFSLSVNEIILDEKVGDVTYSQIAGTNIQTMSGIAIKEYSSVVINVNKFAPNEQVEPFAEIYGVSFTCDDDKIVVDSRTGEITTKAYFKDNNEFSTINCVVSYYTNVGIVQSGVLQVKVKVFRAIKTLQIVDQNGTEVQDITLYAIANNSMYYYNNLASKTVGYKINKSASASHFSVSSWSVEGDYVDVTQNFDNTVLLKAKTDITGDKQTATVNLKIKQFNKTYVASLKVFVVAVKNVTDITNIQYSINGSAKQNLANSLITENNCKGKMYFDMRDVDAGSNVDISYNILPFDATFKDVILHFVPNKINMTDSISLVSSRRFTVNKAGNGKLYIIPKTMFVQDQVVSDNMLTNCAYIEIDIADGKTKETAFKISTVNDLLKMGTADSLKEFRYYQFVNDVDVSRIKNWQAIGNENSKFGFRGNVDGKYIVQTKNEEDEIIEIEKIATVKGLNFTRSNSNVGLFGVVTDGAIENLNVQVQNVAFETTSNVIFGSLASSVSGATIQNINVSIVNSGIVVNQENNLTFGGVIGENNVVLANCKVSGNINIAKKTGSTSQEDVLVGGIVGLNNNQIIGNNSNVPQTISNASQITLDDSQEIQAVNPNTMLKNSNNINSTVQITFAGNANTYIGGIAGQNKGTISGVVANVSIVGKNNVGGIAGESKGIISNCTSIIYNKTASNNSFAPALEAEQNVGGIVGKLSGGTIEQNIVLALDRTNYYDNNITSISAQIVGSDKVGGVVGYAESDTNSTLNITKTYISTYFVREISNIYGGTIAIKPSNLTNPSIGGIVGAINVNSSVRINQCFAKIDINSNNVKNSGLNVTNNLFGLSSSQSSLIVDSYAIVKTDLTELNICKDVNNIQSEDNIVYYCLETNASAFAESTGTEYAIINNGKPYLTALFYIGQPQDISVNIVEKFALASNVAYLNYFVGEENGNIINFDALVEYVNNPSAIEGFINVFSSNENIIAIDLNNEKLIVKGSGRVTLTFTSLLNNTLTKTITVQVINKVKENSLGLFKDPYLSTQVDSTINLDVNSSMDVYVGLQTDNNDQYFSENYTSNNIIVRFIIENTTLDTLYATNNDLININGKSWLNDGGNKYIDIASNEKISFVSYAFSGTITLKVQVLISVNIDGTTFTKVINNQEVSYTIVVAHKITNVSTSIESAEISVKDILELDVVVETDNSSDTEPLKQEDITLLVSDGLVEIELNGTENHKEQKFGFITVEFVKTELEINKITYSYKISVNEKFDNINVKQFELLFKAVNNNKAESIQTSFNFIVKPQPVENIGLQFFANAEKDENGEYTINEVPTSLITAGQTGILKINTYPSSAKLEKVEVEYSTNTAYSMQINQFLFGSDNKYYQIKPSAVVINGGKGISLTGNANGIYGYCNVNTDETTNTSYVTENKISTDGNLFVGLTLGGNVVEGIPYNITVRVKTVNGQIFQKTITLTSSLRPALSLINNSDTNEQQFDGQNPIAVGVEKNFTLQITKLVENEEQLKGISFNLAEISDYNEPSVGTSIPFDENEKNKNGVFIFGDVAEVSRVNVQNIGNNIFNLTYKIKFTENALNKCYRLKATLTKTVNEFQTTYQTGIGIDYGVKKYVIKGVTLDDPDFDGSTLKISLGQTKTLKLKLIIDSALLTEEQIKELNEQFSQYCGIFYYDENNKQVQVTQPKPEQNEDDTTNTENGGEAQDSVKPVFSMFYTENKTTLTANKKENNGNPILHAGFYLTYYTNNEGAKNPIEEPVAVTYQEQSGNATKEIISSIYDGKSIPKEYIIKELKFDINIYDSSSINNYIPVSSEEDLLGDNFQDGGYYRLTKDILVTNPWTPITKEIACLDGNGYSITLSQGFDKEYLKNEVEVNAETGVETIIEKDVNLGLFASLTKNMRVYNLTVKLPYLFAKNVPQVDNDNKESIITYYNDFTEYKYNLLNVGFIAGVNNGVIYNCNAEMVDLADNLNTYATIKTNAQTTFKIGGITGVNDVNGFITNSRSSMVAYVNRGNIGGLVGENKNVIASSYYKAPIVGGETQIVLSNNPTEENNSSIAGLVAVNSGEIRTSYVEGCNYDGLQFTDGYIQSSIITGAFVSDNSGSIENCYSNIPVSGTAQTSGFIYSNSGEITNCVAMSKVAEKHLDHTAFVGTKNSGKIIQNTGTIENCYYTDTESSNYHSKMLPVTGVNKVVGLITENNVNKNKLPTLLFNTFSSSTEIEDGIWKVVSEDFIENKTTYSGKKLTLQDASKIENGHIENTGAEVVSDINDQGEKYVYTKHIWNNMKNNKQIAPYIISNAEEFNNYYSNRNENLVDKGKFAHNVRIVRNIEFSKYIQPQSYNIELTGKLEVNGMTINNIYLPGDELIDGNVDNFGLFKKVTNTIVKDVNLVVTKLYSNSATSVGTLAGTISNSYVNNVSIETGSNAILGKNFVGGLAGTVESSVIRLINVQACVNAIYSNQSHNILTTTLYKQSDAVYEYSYAGGAVGLVKDGEGQTNNSFFQDITITGETKVLAYYAGGAFGYFGKGNSASYVTNNVQEGAYIQGTFIAGGLVAHMNNATIEKSSIQNNGQVNDTYYKGAPNIVGGIAGLLENSTIKYCYSTQNLKNDRIMIGGGIAGVTFGGEISQCYVNAQIRVLNMAGGIVGASATNASMGTDDSTKWFSDYEFNNKTLGINNCAVYASSKDTIESASIDTIESVSRKDKAMGIIIASVKYDAIEEEDKINNVQLSNNFVIGTSSLKTIGATSQSIKQSVKYDYNIDDFVNVENHNIVLTMVSQGKVTTDYFGAISDINFDSKFGEQTIDDKNLYLQIIKNLNEI